MCKDCIYYLEMSKEYGRCTCEDAGGFDMIVSYDSSCDFFTPKNKDEKKVQS
jgi:hypothetical protein